MNTDELFDTVELVKFEHHPTIEVRVHCQGDDWWLQLLDTSLDEAFNTGRKWRLSRYMTRSEVVGTLWKAYMTWLEHEARESFTYDGRAIYGPHLNVDALWRAAGNPTNYEYRSNPS